MASLPPKYRRVRAPPRPVAAVAQACDLSIEEEWRMWIPEPCRPSAKTWHRLIQSRSFESINPFFVPDASVDRLGYRTMTEALRYTTPEGRENASNLRIAAYVDHANSALNERSTAGSLLPPLFCGDDDETRQRGQGSSQTIGLWITTQSNFHPSTILDYWFAHHVTKRHLACTADGIIDDIDRDQVIPAMARSITSGTCSLFDPNLDDVFVPPLGVERRASSVQSLRYSVLQDIVNVLQLFPMGTDTIMLSYWLVALRNVRRSTTVSSLEGHRGVSEMRHDIHRKIRGRVCRICDFDSSDTKNAHHFFYTRSAVLAPLICLFDSPKIRWLILPKFVLPHTIASIVSFVQQAVVRGGARPTNTVSRCSKTTLTTWIRCGGDAAALVTNCMLYATNRLLYKWHYQLMRLAYDHEREREYNNAFVSWLTHPDQNIVWRNLKKSVQCGQNESTNHVIQQFWISISNCAFSTPVDPCWWYLRLGMSAYIPLTNPVTKPSYKYAFDGELKRAFKTWMRKRTLWQARVGTPQAWVAWLPQSASQSTALHPLLVSDVPLWELLSEQSRDHFGSSDMQERHSTRDNTRIQTWRGLLWCDTRQRYRPVAPWWDVPIATYDTTV